MPPITRSTYPKYSTSFDLTFVPAELQPDKFNELLRTHGVRIHHEKAVPCSNYKGKFESGNHPVDCPFCDNGFQHYDGGEFTAYFSSNTLNRIIAAHGFLDPGTAMMTFPSKKENGDIVYIRYFDKITLLDFEDRFEEVIQRRDGDTDILRYHALKVDYLVCKDKEYVEQVDFNIDDNGNIKWISSNRPDRNAAPSYGGIYSISYLYRPVYRIVNILHEGRFTNIARKLPAITPIRLPQQAIIKKDFLLSREDKDGNIIKETILP